MKKEIILSYFELWTTYNEKDSSCCGRYLDMVTAKEDMKFHGNWYRPYGTGSLYRIDIIKNTPEQTITINKILVLERN